jgi:UDP-N-acetyl-D-glucosamine dehydrogenase
MSIAQDLIARAERREALFGIVGLGYVGLPLAVELANAGYRVLGFDVQQKVVDGINAGRSHVKDVTNAQLQAAVGAGRLSATTDTARLAEPDAVSICVPTPLSKF